MTLIDTSAWIHSLRPNGDSELTEKVRGYLRTGEAAWCPIIRLELWNGARGKHEKHVLSDFERDLIELKFDDAVWDASYNLARKARQKGITVPATDLLVAGCAWRYSVNIEHDDKHLAALSLL